MLPSGAPLGFVMEGSNLSHFVLNFHEHISLRPLLGRKEKNWMASAFLFYSMPGAGGERACVCQVSVYLHTEEVCVCVCVCVCVLSVVYMPVTEYLFLHTTNCVCVCVCVCVLAACQQCHNATRIKPIKANMVYTGRDIHNFRIDVYNSLSLLTL